MRTTRQKRGHEAGVSPAYDANQVGERQRL